MNPQIEESVQFTALNASQEFLNYLQTNALIVDLWGLQGTMLLFLVHGTFFSQYRASISRGAEVGEEGVQGLDSVAKSHLPLVPGF